jgi:DNA-binding transcriptional ArsR family regulator
MILESRQRRRGGGTTGTVTMWRVYRLRSTIKQAPLVERTVNNMLDQLTRDIKTRLDAVLAEADKLRHALSALGSRDHDGELTTPARSSDAKTRSSRHNRSTSTSASSSREATRSRAKNPAAAHSPVPATPRSATPGDAAANGGGRAASGAAKKAILSTLANGEAMTASEIAAATGLGRASVSTSLSRLAKTGELTKAPRGYRITQPSSAAPTDTPTP